MEILSPAWDSTTGFLSAFADEVPYHVITSLSDLPESGPLAELARWLIVGEEDASYRHAVDAAHQIFDTIQSTPHLQGRQFHWWAEPEPTRAPKSGTQPSSKGQPTSRASATGNVFTLCLRTPESSLFG